MAKKEYNESSKASYVDKQKVEKKLQYIFKTYGVSDVLRKKIRKSLDDSATDAVHVVRCKDCKEFYECMDGTCFCCHLNGLGGDITGDSFCSYGEPKPASE